MAALAPFFRIDPAHFTDDDYYQRLTRDPNVLAALRDARVRLITNRVVGLSPKAIETVAAKIENLRREQHLDRRSLIR